MASNNRTLNKVPFCATKKYDAWRREQTHWAEVSLSYARCRINRPVKWQRVLSSSRSKMHVFARAGQNGHL